MKICERGLNFIQIIDAGGSVRGCCLMRDSYMGNLIEDDLETIYHSELAEKIRKPLLEQTYDNCPVDNCPYLANGTMEEHLIEIEKIPELPDTLLLAYEGKCNYNCTCCTSHMHMKMTKEHEKEYGANYELIEKKLFDILPYIKTIGAHGRGELFASPRILNVLSKWKPLAADDEIEVMLETNGSLFDEEHWKKIENLGRYNLRVAITVMSFHEPVYQFLSGVKYPISRLVDNLHFVKRLREQNIINELEIATVLQEQNFREMPEFVKRCIEEFGADYVRIRPIVPGGSLNQFEQWFMNVRNPEHPYYYEYKKVMTDEIFKDPKVLLWSGELESKRVGLSELVDNNVDELRHSLSRERRVTDILSSIMSTEAFARKFKIYMEQRGFKRGAVWGVGKIGKAFLNSIDLKESHIERLFDKRLGGTLYKDILVEEPDFQNINEIDVIIVTFTAYQDNMKDGLAEYGGRVITLEEMIQDIKSL